MKYLHYDALTIQSYKEDVWQLLCRYDDTFIPPLSSRESTSQAILTPTSSTNIKPTQYFNNLLLQAIIVALDEESNRVVGFMSYKPSYTSTDLNDGIDTIYISTIIVDEAYRGRGITTTFYALIEQIGIQNNKPIMTRTWSTNTVHIKVLQKVGLLEVKRLPHARGENIDTVYYRKPLGG